MARMLRRDICDLQDPSLLHDEIPDISDRRHAIPRALRYACLHWLHHLEQSFPDTEVQQCLLEFLEQRLLFLVEACAVLGELDAAVKVLRSARQHVMHWPGPFPQIDSALALLYDGWRMAIDFFDPISLSALHVYESALPCCPAKSLLRLTYQDLLAEVTSFQFEDGLDDHWHGVTRVIDVKTSVFVLALSPDGSQIVAICQVASASHSGSREIKLWDTAAGLLVRSLPLEGSYSKVDLVHNGSVIAYRNEQKCFLWQPSKQAVPEPFDILLQESMCGDGLQVSHDDSQIAFSCLSNSTSATSQNPFTVIIRIFSVNSRKQLTYFPITQCPGRRYFPQIRSMEFSRRDDYLMFCASSNVFDENTYGIIFLLNPSDGQLLWHSHCYSYNPFCFFSADEGIIIISKDSKTGKFQAELAFTINGALPGINVTATPSHLLKAKKWRFRTLLRIQAKSNATVELQSPTQVAETSSSYEPPRVITLMDGFAGLMQGNKIAGFGRWTRTNWKSRDEECFGVVHTGSQLQTQFPIADLNQVVPHITSESYSSSFPETDPDGYRLECTSDRADMMAYKSDSKETYLIIATSTGPTTKVFRRKIVPKRASSKSYSSSGVRCAFSPNSTYFATVAGHRRRLEIWDIGSFTCIGSAPIPTSVLTWTSVFTFSRDEKLLVLQWNSESTLWAFVVYSIEDKTIKQVGSFSPPSSIGENIPPQECKVVSVTPNAVDFLCTDAVYLQDENSAYHFRWQRTTSTVVPISKFAVRGRLTNLAHTTSLKRILCREWLAEENTGREYALNLEVPLDAPDAANSDGTDTIRTYKVDDDNDPKAFYDRLSWSDLCMDMDGWIRQRNRRICWLPERYRPTRIDNGGGTRSE